METIGKSLRQRALEERPWRRDPPFGDFEAKLKAAPLIDASQVLTYFFERGPQGHSFPARAFPLVKPAFGDAVFLEGELGPGAILGAALALDQGTTTPRRGLRPGNLGFLVLTREPGEAADERVALLLRITPVIERLNGRLSRPRPWWEAPVSDDGRVVGYEELGEVPAFLREGRRAQALGRTYSPLAGAALFAVCCLNAVPGGYASLRSIGDRRRRHRLEAGELLTALDEQGRATGVGLPRALEECAGLFTGY